VVVGKLASPSFKLLPANEEGGGKYQPTKATKQQGDKTVKREATKHQMGGVRRYLDPRRQSNKIAMRQ
jgi:hypothetical protein